MPTPPQLDVDRLLMPVNGEVPADAGDWGRLYAELKATRNSAAQQEKMLDDGHPEADPKKRDADWAKIRDLAPRLLAIQKDLGAAAYLTEALARSGGFAGLRDGFRLTRGLVEGFWPQLCPVPIDGESLTDAATECLALLASLNGRGRDGSLILPIKMLPLTEAREKGPFALWHYQDVEHSIGSSSEPTRERASALRADIDHEVSLTSDEFFLALRDDVSECLAEFEQLTAAVQQHSGLSAGELSLAFPSSNIENALRECLAIAERHAAERSPSPDGGDAASADVAADHGGGQAGGAPSEGALTRDAALRTLESLAKFFEKSDPHSPLAPALRQIVRWARTPLPDLYAELIPNDDARNDLFKLIGIKPPPREDS
jgi:type VI secretion system protein ImpA